MHAVRISQACVDGEIVGAVTALSVANLFYIIRRTAGIDGAFRAVDQCVASFDVLAVTSQTIDLARTFSGSDFEDNIQIGAAIEANLDRIVTRDPKGFANSPIRAMSSGDFVHE